MFFLEMTNTCDCVGNASMSQFSRTFRIDATGGTIWPILKRSVILGFKCGGQPSARRPHEQACNWVWNDWDDRYHKNIGDICINIHIQCTFADTYVCVFAMLATCAATI